MHFDHASEAGCHDVFFLKYAHGHKRVLCRLGACAHSVGAKLSISVASKIYARGHKRMVALDKVSWNRNY